MKRPYVILNSAMTLDGKISSKSGDSKISGDEDLDRLHRLRSEVDAVMVGIGTVLADDPDLTVRRVKGDNPLRVVVDSVGRIPSDSKILDDSAPSVIAVSERAAEKDRERLKSAGSRVIVAGDEMVDLKAILEALHDQNVNKLLLEGGSTLNWSMLSQGLVDEARIAIRPSIVGGEDAKSLAGGAGFERISDGVELSLRKTEQVGRTLLLIYDVEGSVDD